jgi:hypothetical protein
MVDTPEGKVKRKITVLLNRTDQLWYTGGNTTGYGRPGLDYQGIYRGMGFVVEAKTEDGVLSPRQRLTLMSVLAADGRAFVVIGSDPEHPGMASLASWLEGRSILPPGLYGYPVERLNVKQLDT